LDTVETNNQT